MFSILSGGKLRKTRLHDEKGNMIPLQRIFKNMPNAFITALLRVAFGHRPSVPWISFAATNIISRHLSKESKVLEFGSGMSTIWYSKHSKEVFSIEDNKTWYQKINNEISDRGILNIKYIYAEKTEDYCQFMESSKLKFDLIMVDGSYRSLCVEKSFKLLNNGGIFYLDNSDKDSSGKGGDMRLAEDLAIKYAKEIGAEVTYFTDFAPTQLFGQQGLMIKKSK